MGNELFVLWALVGWCATPPYPRPWPWPDPDPDPNPWIIKVVGVVGGMVGGWLFNALLVPGGIIIDSGAIIEGMGAVNAAATAVGAYVGSVFLSDMYGLIRGKKG